jgi:ABC-type multidrug transport system ATPase subunit
VCDRVAIVHRGSLVALDAPGRLVEQLGKHVLEVAVHDCSDLVAKVLAEAGLGRKALLVAPNPVSLTYDGGVADLESVLSHLAAPAKSRPR